MKFEKDKANQLCLDEIGMIEFWDAFVVRIDAWNEGKTPETRTQHRKRILE